MKIAQFRRKPLVVEAVRFSVENKDEVRDWIKTNTVAFTLGDAERPILAIRTRDGVLNAHVGDWIVTNRAEGDFYPLPHEAFQAMYEAAGE